ncbi:MAG: oligosaccharide flippase family protein [Gammaproteobacteria bacterium]|nr:oligosaccharide flippase family protein [Gammaproteobacteria bacterium]
MLRSTFFAGITSFADGLLLLLLILAGRILGAEDFGRLAFALALSTVLAFVLNLGLDSVSIRRIAVDRGETGVVVGSVLGGKLAVSVLVMGLYLAGIHFAVDDPLTRSVTYVLGFAGAMRGINLTLRAFLHGQERFRAESAVVLTERLLVLGLGGGLLIATGDLVSFVLAFPIARVIGFFLLIAQVQSRAPRADWTFDVTLLSKLLRQGLPLGLAILTYGLYNQIDVLLLTMFLPTGDVGEFASAYRLYEGLLIVPSVLTIVIYPRLSVLAAGYEDKFRDLLGRSIKYVTVLAVPLVVVAMLLAEEIIRLFYGDGFEPGADVLQLLAVALWFFFVYAVVDTALRSRALERAVLRVNMAGLATKVALGLVLIPTLGIRGAAFAGIGGIAVMLTGAVAALGLDALPLRRTVTAVAKAGAGAAAMALAIVFVPAGLGASNLIVVAALALVVYAVVLLAAGILDGEEWAAVKGVHAHRR